MTARDRAALSGHASKRDRTHCAHLLNSSKRALSLGDGGLPLRAASLTLAWRASCLAATDANKPSAEGLSRKSWWWTRRANRAKASASFADASETSSTAVAVWRNASKAAN